MFIEGDVFRVKGDEYKVRCINKSLICFLEPVLYRDSVYCVTGGLNRVYRMEDLEDLEYLDVTYRG